MLSGCNDSSNSGIIIKDAHLYVPLEGSDMAAGYLRLENHQLKGVYPYDVSKSTSDLIAQSYSKTYNLIVYRIYQS